MQHSSSSVRRCAIYTRKSSEEGLEQDFNSLHAQREACEAFIKSQASEGWRPLKTSYDDGGISGGTMERPALKRLLGDIRDGRVEVVVVYKVDRLTRSLADFAKMVEVFDAHGASFVAVTQQFNTTTSMGRLTLNVLLSFAQFEREVTGERIRDKIAASKAKGMWMGGYTPLGYDLKDRKLVVNESEAVLVRDIYQRYLELCSVRLLKQDLDRRDVVSKVRVSKSGNQSGGASFSRGALYELLANPIYLGEIRHKKERYPGQHEPILDRELWDQVQERLNDTAARKATPRSTGEHSVLAGKLFDREGRPLYASGARGKKGRRYRYYVSRHLVRGEGGEEREGWRIAARELEGAVFAAVADILTNEADLSAVLSDAGATVAHIQGALKVARKRGEDLRDRSSAVIALNGLLDRIILKTDGFHISVTLNFLLEHLKPECLALPAVTHFVPFRIARRGVEMRFVLAGSGGRKVVDRPLLKAVARGYRWFQELASGRATSTAEIAGREAIDDGYVSRLMLLSLLAPQVVDSIAEGRPMPELTANRLRRPWQLPLDWNPQFFKFSSAVPFSSTSVNKISTATR